MPPRRLRPPQNPIRVLHDGRSVVAEAGEPVAVSLIAAGRQLLARSPKLHRPRGPYCLRGACDGCLTRVGGEPNMMACLVPATEGLRIETQNVLGSRGADLLRATDYVFPHGFDHHRLMAGTPVLGSAMQQIARKVAGVGRMPESDTVSDPSQLRTPDVLVVGAGSTGCRVALELRARAPNLSLLLLEAALEPGGRLRLIDPAAWHALYQELSLADLEVGHAVRLGSAVTGLYWSAAQANVPTALVSIFGSSRTRVDRVTPRAVVLATGGHDYVAVFDNNDLPGVYSARAALSALRYGVLVGERVALVGSSPELDAFAHAAHAHAQFERISVSALVGASGSTKVTGALVQTETGTETVHVDAIIVGGPRAPAFELAVQAGMSTQFEPERGFGVVGQHSEAAPGIFMGTGQAPAETAEALLDFLGVGTPP